MQEAIYSTAEHALRSAWEQDLRIAYRSPSAAVEDMRGQGTVSLRRGERLTVSDQIAQGVMVRQMVRRILVEDQHDPVSWSVLEAYFTPCQTASRTPEVVPVDQPVHAIQARLGRTQRELRTLRRRQQTEDRSGARPKVSMTRRLIKHHERVADRLEGAMRSIVRSRDLALEDGGGSVMRAHRVQDACAVLSKAFCAEGGRLSGYPEAFARMEIERWAGLVAHSVSSEMQAGEMSRSTCIRWRGVVRMILNTELSNAIGAVAGPLHEAGLTRQAE